MSDHLDRAAEVIAAQMHGLTTPSMCRGIALALEDAGLLVTPERDAAVAAEWADHFEVCQGMVGTERLTVESMIASLRGPRPFGRMAGESPEEFAAMLDRCAHTAEGMGERLTDTYRVADLVRARDEALVDELVRRGVLREDRVRDNRICRCNLHRADPLLYAPCDAHEPITLPTRYVTEWEE